MRSIILGTVLGGVLISPRVAGSLLAFDLPSFDTGIDTPAEAAISVIAFVYVMAALFNLDSRHRRPLCEAARQSVETLRDFAHCCSACGATSSGRSRSP